MTSLQQQRQESAEGAVVAEGLSAEGASRDICMYTVYVCQTRCGCCSLLIIPILKKQQSCTGVLVARAGFGVPFQRCNRQIIIINAGYFVPIGKLGIATSISVCLAVCPRPYLRKHTSDFHKFLWMFPTAVARSSSGGIMIFYVLPVL